MMFSIGYRMDLVQRLRRQLRELALDSDGARVRAAVVVPLRDGPAGVEVLFEQRPMHLSESPGEVSFPGGRVEEGESLLEAALRELEEELGVSPSAVEVLGRLRTRQRRRDEFIYPFVCLLDPAERLRLQSSEVEELFGVPIEALLTREFGEARIVEEYTVSHDFPAQYLPQGKWRGRHERPVHFLRYDRFFIWGLTAAILLEVLGLLRSDALPPQGDPAGDLDRDLPGIFDENP